MHCHSTRSDALAATDSLVERVTSAVADELDADPLDLEPLWYAADPDALAVLAADGVHMQFRFAGCEVFVDGTEDVEAFEV